MKLIMNFKEQSSSTICANKETSALGIDWQHLSWFTAVVA